MPGPDEISSTAPGELGRVFVADKPLVVGDGIAGRLLAQLAFGRELRNRHHLSLRPRRYRKAPAAARRPLRPGARKSAGTAALYLMLAVMATFVVII